MAGISVTAFDEVRQKDVELYRLNFATVSACTLAKSVRLYHILRSLA